MAHATLCFPDYPTAIAAAKALGFWVEHLVEEDGTTVDRGFLNTGGQTIRPDGTAFSWMIDEIGSNVVDTPAVVHPETGEVVTPATYKPGYYVNVIGEIPEEALAPYIVPYGSGGRVFAGTAPE